MSMLNSCPICKTDMYVYVTPGNGLSTKFVCGCNVCGASTGACDTEIEAERQWNILVEGAVEPELRALALEELREMDRKPVWVKELEEWAIVLVDTVGQYKNMPFVKGSNFNFNVVTRKLTCYDRQPKGA